MLGIYNPELSIPGEVRGSNAHCLVQYKVSLLTLRKLMVSQKCFSGGILLLHVEPLATPLEVRNIVVNGCPVSETLSLLLKAQVGKETGGYYLLGRQQF